MVGNYNTDDAGLSPKMALCLAAISLVGIDGEFKEDELNKLRKLIQADESAFLKAFNFYNEHPMEVCIKIVTIRLNDEQKRCAYQVLNDLAHADHEVAEPEEKLLRKYASSFGLSDKFIKSVKVSSRKEFNLEAFS